MQFSTCQVNHTEIKMRFTSSEKDNSGKKKKDFDTLNGFEVSVFRTSKDFWPSCCVRSICYD